MDVAYARGLVARPRSVAAPAHDHSRSFAAIARSDGPPDERQRLVRRAAFASPSSGSATGARTSSATCTSCPEAELVAVCDLRRDALAKLARRYPALAPRDATRRRARRPERRRGRDRDARSRTHYPLALRGARGGQARLRREAARGLVRGGARSSSRSPRERGLDAHAGPHLPLQPAREPDPRADPARDDSATSTSSR